MALLFFSLSLSAFPDLGPIITRRCAKFDVFFFIRAIFTSSSLFFISDSLNLHFTSHVFFPRLFDKMHLFLCGMGQILSLLLATMIALDE